MRLQPHDNKRLRTGLVGFRVLAETHTIPLLFIPPSNGKVWSGIGFMYYPLTNTWSAQLTMPAAWDTTVGGLPGASKIGSVGDSQGKFESCFFRSVLMQKPQ